MEWVVLGSATNTDNLVTKEELNQQATQQSQKNAEQDGRLDNVEAKNAEQDTAIANKIDKTTQTASDLNDITDECTVYCTSTTANKPFSINGWCKVTKHPTNVDYALQEYTCMDSSNINNINNCKKYVREKIGGTWTSWKSSLWVQEEKKESNGYCIMDNGLIFQWGALNITELSTVINFEKTFKNVPRIFVTAIDTSNQLCVGTDSPRNSPYILQQRD